jgi:hypothetical protein
MLHISGTFSDCWNDSDISNIKMQALLGIFDDGYEAGYVDSAEMILTGPNGSASLGTMDMTSDAHMDIQTRIELDSNQSFDLYIPVTRSTFLSFVPVEPEVTDSHNLIVVSVYELGRLLDLYKHEPANENLAR